MGRILSRKEWSKRENNIKIALMILVFLFLIVIFILTGMLIIKIRHGYYNDIEIINREYRNNVEKIEPVLPNKEVIKKQYLHPNPYSRPQLTLKKVKAIVIHYTANPGSSAQDNWDYFNGLAFNKERSASSHYIIGLKGEIIQCIPLTEIAYAVRDRNVDTISIECCHPDKSGKYNKKTYSSLVSLAASLCVKFNLDKKDILRHYDVDANKKLCPLYYVKHEKDWKKLKKDIIKEEDRLVKSDSK